MKEQDCKEPICRDTTYLSFRKKLFVGNKVTHQCPLNKQQLGLYSWSVLHTFAAYYPETPNQNDKKAMKNLLQGFKQLYPCRHCRANFQTDYLKDPPNFDNNKQITIWVCRQHNYVNKILGKSQYDCDYQKLIKRWKTGCDTDEL